MHGHNALFLWLECHGIHEWAHHLTQKPSGDCNKISVHKTHETTHTQRETLMRNVRECIWNQCARYQRHRQHVRCACSIFRIVAIHKNIMLCDHHALDDAVILFDFFFMFHI